MSTIKVGLRYIDIWKTSLEKEVQRYEAEPTIKGGIVFYGDSDFTRWSEKYGNPNLVDEIRGASGKVCCINRGFGSSCPEHMLYYYPRMVRPLEPRVLIISAGFGNGSAFGYTADEMIYLFERVVEYARADFPDIRIYLYGESRKKHAQNAKRLECINRAKAIMESTPNCYFIDSTDFEPLNTDGIICEDNIHFNAKGYAAFGDFWRSALKDELAEL